jgi:hypothetical protein
MSSVPSRRSSVVCLFLLVSATCAVPSSLWAQRRVVLGDCDDAYMPADGVTCEPFVPGASARPSDQARPQEDAGAATPSDDSIRSDTAPSLSDIAPPSLSAGSLAASYGGVAGAAGVPSMIGDFFAGGYNYVNIPGSSLGQGATVAIAGGDRQYKFADNNSPFPQDRVFFNYHHFHNAVIDLAGNDRNLDRYTFGIEKTCFDGWASFEVRLPFANTVNADPTAYQDTDLDDTEFGNVALAFKGLVCRDATKVVSLGLGVILPTGDDFSVGGDVVFNRFANETVYLQPFLGVYHAPHDRLFTQFFTQFDFAANSNTVQIGEMSSDLRAQSLLMLDYSVGVWVLRDECNKYVRGIAPMVELHYTTTLEDQDYGAYAGQGIFVQDLRRDVLNLTGGLFFRLGEMSSLKIGAVAPLRDGMDKAFDSEIGVQFVRNY